MSDPAVLAEVCSNSIMEYMACGLPVVCADSRRCGEIVRDGVTGYVVPPLNPVALAGKPTYLREHLAVRVSMGVAGQARIARESTLTRMVDDYVKAYESSIVRRPRTT